MASNVEIKALNVVNEWLQGEHEYQFGKNVVTHQAHPDNSRNYILDVEIPNKWARFQTFHNQFRYDADPELGDKKVEPQLIMQVGQNILKMAGAARGAFVWEAVKRGMNIEEASSLSWVNFDRYLRRVEKGEMTIPSREYLDPHNKIDHVIDRLVGTEDAYSRHANGLMLMSAGLAVSTLVEISDYGKVVVPEPGYPSGTLVKWNYKF